MGFSAEKTFDIEVWIPSEKKYAKFQAVHRVANSKQEECRLNIKMIKMKLIS